ncbi:hypothetical protein [Stappia sp.]|uniref:hypothetical protein n=1 Tax=Stappia sp. TaxID=1870903 RepID=UPI003A9900DB
MWKLAALLFIVIAPTLAGICALMPMTFYGINDYEPWLLAAFAGVGVVLAVPVSLFVAAKISALTKAGPRAAS